MANEVTGWLNSPNRSYADGVALYNKYKKDSKFDEYFAQVRNAAEGDMHLQLLKVRLQKIERIINNNPSLVKPEAPGAKPIMVKAIDTSRIQPSKKAQEFKRPIVVENPLVDVKELPAELQVKYHENKDITRLANAKHEAIKKLPIDKAFDKDRKELALQLTELDNKRAENWKAIDTWWANREKTPANQKPADPNFQEKLNRINNLRNYIRRSEVESKNKPEKKKINDKKIANWKKELDELA